MASRGLCSLIAAAWLMGGLAALPMAVANESAPTPATGRAATPDEIAAWVAELDTDQYLAREQATRRLFEAGESGLDALLAAANGERLEPADRAVWILRRLGRSSDNDLAIAALERLVQLRERPSLVARAELELAERRVAACQQRLQPLGAEVSAREEQILLYGNVVIVAPVVHARLTDKWRGTANDLRCLAELRGQRFFRLEGPGIDDAVVGFFREKEKLTYLQLFDTKVTLAAVNALKERHPDAVVYLRNQAKMGVGGENHAAGVLVQQVEPGSAAAAAGIVANDIIASIDGHALPDFDRLTAHISQHRPGDKVDVEIIRGAERKKLLVTLGSWAGQG